MDDNLSTEEILLQKHRSERKQLQAEVQKLKHSVPKGDKKRKKEITTQIAQLESELEQRQEEELNQLKQDQVQSNTINQIGVDLEKLTTQDHENFASGNEVSEIQNSKSNKKSKAQKRREKKEQEAKEREERIKVGDLENLQGPRHLELKAIKEKLKARGLSIYEVPSDGDCLYAAIAHSLKPRELKYSVSELRKIAADYMRGCPDEFVPFLCNSDTGEPYTSHQFLQYCEQLESTPEWGGQLEIQALSSALQCPIEVVQADVPSIHCGENYSQKPITLTYHRHTYKLGEHYNSVQPFQEEDNEEDAT